MGSKIAQSFGERFVNVTGVTRLQFVGCCARRYSVQPDRDGELLHPARPDGLTEGGASWFCVGACIRRGHIGSRLRRRRFGVSHSYWFDGVVPRADTRFLSRLNVALLSYPRKERVVPCGTTSESGAVTRNAHLTSINGRSDNNCIAV